MRRKYIFVLISLSLLTMILHGCGNDRDRDAITPTVISASPPENATGVAVNSNVKVRFSETMNPSFLNRTTFIVRTGGTKIDGTISYGGTFATFLPLTTLSTFTGYTGMVTTGAKDSNGNALTSNYSWGFVTGNSTTSTISFEDDIQPIFDDNCTDCHHSGELLPSFLPLTEGVSYSNLVNRASTYTAGETLVIPSNSTGSILYKRVSWISVGAQMPKEGDALDTDKLTDIKTWIDEGALDN